MSDNASPTVSGPPFLNHRPAARTSLPAKSFTDHGNIFARECVLLGAMLADKKIRQSIDPATFHHALCRQAATEMQRGAHADVKAIREFLAYLGVEWTDGPALKAVERRQGLAARCERACQAVIRELGQLSLAARSALVLRRMTEEETIQQVKSLLPPEAAAKYEL
jgi:hypothetical protein